MESQVECHRKVNYQMLKTLISDVNLYGECVVTSDVIDKIFDVPKHIDPIKQLALDISGNRPAETQVEVIAFHCKANGLEFMVDHLTWKYHFRMKKVKSK